MNQNALQCLFQKPKHTKVQIIQQKPKPQFLPLLQFLVLYLSIPNTKLTLLSEYNMQNPPTKPAFICKRLIGIVCIIYFPLHSHNMDTKASHWGFLFTIPTFHLFFPPYHLFRIILRLVLPNQLTLVIQME